MSGVVSGCPSSSSVNFGVGFLSKGEEEETNTMLISRTIPGPVYKCLNFPISTEASQADRKKERGVSR
jgi:hypothetical protein